VVYCRGFQGQLRQKRDARARQRELAVWETAKGRTALEHIGSRQQSEAVRDFHEARRRAALEQILSRLSGRSADLLPYEQVRQHLKITGQKAPQLKEIPLSAVVGSVGRYTDFTRSFLPREGVDPHRWAGIKVAASGLVGLPPIDVYQIDQAYFVVDGNHRVSVARQLGAAFIEARVVELNTALPLTPEDRLEDLILRSEHAKFLERTGLDRVRPGSDLALTSAGQYWLLEEHLEVHHFVMELDQKREIPFEEAVAHWYDTVYRPVIGVIREKGILKDFPGRTETDLFLWTFKHRGELAEQLGWQVDPAVAVRELAIRASPRPARTIARFLHKIRKAIIPQELGAGPTPGEWRREHVAVREDVCLFAEILVPLGGKATSWGALAQATEIAQREDARVHGLYVMTTRSTDHKAQSRSVQAEFEARCAAAGVRGDFATTAGKPAHRISDRSRFVDLVVLHLGYPPPPNARGKLSSGFRTIIQRSVAPVLAVPGPATALHHALLAYDGSPRAQEALFVATYLAGCWQIPLTVLTVPEGDHVTPATMERAREYLTARDVPATFIAESGPVGQLILMVAEEQQADLIIIGGYSRHPARGAILGSAVDEVLRSRRQPVLICQ
jgi:nucleotide-binding universal stress UspA family protein